MSYGEQARTLGDVRKSRAVGARQRPNPISIIVPCHRVVGSDGSLTGFGGGLDAKAWLLDHEKRVPAREAASDALLRGRVRRGLRTAAGAGLLLAAEAGFGLLALLGGLAPGLGLLVGLLASARPTGAGSVSGRAARGPRRASAAVSAAPMPRPRRRPTRRASAAPWPGRGARSGRASPRPGRPRSGCRSASPSCSMQSARHGSVSTVAICSSAPLIRPRAAVARMATVRAAGSSKPLSSRAPHTLSSAWR